MKFVVVAAKYLTTATITSVLGAERGKPKMTHQHQHQ